MARVLLVPTALAALLVAAPAAVPAERAPASVQLVTCESKEAPSGRQAAFEGLMATLPGTHRMWMRFALHERATADGVFVPVEAPGLDVWRKSRPGVARFVYRQEVTALKPGADYRVSVQYRWVDESGETLRSARRRSAVCEQGGSLPNLRVRGISVGPGPQQGTAIYRVSVRNTGASAAREVEVALTVDGTTLTASTLSLLKPFDGRVVVVAGPACARSVSAVVDPENAIRESVEDDNVRSVPCPA